MIYNQWKTSHAQYQVDIFTGMFPMQGFVKICRYEIDVLNTMEYVVIHKQYHLNNHIDNC